MNCIIIEDQPPAQRILKKYINDLGTLTLKATFSNAIEALEFLKTESIDLVFLDIHLPKISGIDFLKMIQHPPHIILTTAFSDYALESYEFSVIDYLLKPFSFQRFVKAIAKIPIKTIAKSTQNTIKLRENIFVKSRYELIKITVDDILFIKSDADYTEIITTYKKHLSAESLRHWLEHLKDNSFVRVHKSYIVNTSKIEKIVGNQIHLLNKIQVPIGRAYKEAFLKDFIK